MLFFVLTWKNTGYGCYNEAENYTWASYTVRYHSGDEVHSGSYAASNPKRRKVQCRQAFLERIV